MCAEPPQPQGFTLVEVLVALVLVSLLLTILFDRTAQARDDLRRSEVQREALLLAQYALAKACAEPFNQAGRDGSSGELRWHVAENLLLSDPQGAFGLIEYEAAVTTARGRRIGLLTVRRLKGVGGP